MPTYLEWDFDNPQHKQRRQPPPVDGEVPELEPTSLWLRIQGGSSNSVLPVIAALKFLSPAVLRSRTALLVLA
jgi:hypothetical protein